MPLYSITGPDGQTYEIEGPEGASREQVIDAVKYKLGESKGIQVQKYIPPPIAEPEAPVERSFLRETADIPLKAGEGVVAGVRMLADAFGANNPVSQNLRSVENYIAELYSAQSKADSKKVAEIMKAAEDEGVLANVKAAFEAFKVAPVDLLVNALGTSAPTIIGGLGAGALKAGAMGIRATQASIGAATGAGVTKGAIYEAVSEELKGSGLTPEQIEQKAQLAQAYDGENLDQILLGTGIGAVAGSVGIEPTLAGVAKRNILQRSAMKQAGAGAVKEGGTEFIQGGQEQLAQNIALQREGFDVPTMRGVVGQGALEGLAGAGLGAPISGMSQRGINRQAEEQQYQAAVARDEAVAEQARQQGIVNAAQAEQQAQLLAQEQAQQAQLLAEEQVLQAREAELRRPLGDQIELDLAPETTIEEVAERRAAGQPQADLFASPAAPAVAPQAAPEPAQAVGLSADDIKQLGVSPRSNVAKALNSVVGQDLANPEVARFVRDTLAPESVENIKINEEAVNSLLGRLTLDTPEALPSVREQARAMIQQADTDFKNPAQVKRYIKDKLGEASLTSLEAENPKVFKELLDEYKQPRAIDQGDRASLPVSDESRLISSVEPTEAGLPSVVDTRPDTVEPTVGEGIEPTAVETTKNITANKYADFLNKTFKRVLMETKGQDILDTMDANNVSPKEVASKFWTDTYYKLPAEVQKRFTQELEASTGMKPGSPISVDANQQVTRAENWMDIADLVISEMADTVEYLEGTERGFTVLMDEANRRFARDETQGSTVVTPSPQLTTTPAATPEERQQRLIARRAEEEAARKEERAAAQAEALAEQRGRTPTGELLPAEQEGLEAAREFEEAGADDAEFEAAKGTAGAFIRQTFGGGQNIAPEERVTLPQFLSALADIMYHIVRRGITNKDQALQQARSELGEAGANVNDFQLNKAFTEATKRVAEERKAEAAQPRKLRDTMDDSEYVEPSTSLIDRLYTPAIADARTDLGALIDKITPKLLSLYQLVDQYGNDLKGLAEHRDLKDGMTVMQRNIKVKADPVLLKWNNFSAKGQNASATMNLNELMRDSTLAKIHPDLAFDHPLNSHLTSDLESRHAILSAKFESLPEEAKSIYKEVRALNDEIFQMRNSEYKKMIDSSFESELAKATPEEVTRIEARKKKHIDEHNALINSIRGPYFTLWRDGEYLTIAESPELTDVRNQLDGDELTPDERKKLAARLRMMEASEDHYQVFANTRKSMADREGEQLKAKGLTVRQTKAEEAITTNSGVSMNMVNNLERLLDKELDRSLDPATRSSLRQAMIDDMLSNMPENSALQRQIKRRNVAGASLDMMKAFANSVERDSFYISRLAYMRPLSRTMIDMRNASKADTKLRDVYNTIRKAMNLDMKQDAHPILSKLTQLSSIYHLGIAPSYILTNLTQPFMITVPQLAGTYGVGKTSKALAKSWVRAARAIKGGREGSLLSNVDLSKAFQGGELRMVKELQDLGKLDIMNNMDTEVYTKGMNPKHAKFWQMFNWTSHNVELVNRLTSALAAYELELDKSKSEPAAIKAARDAIELTQLDYSDSNAALFMKQGQLGGFNRIPMQFRKYQQGMVYLLARNFKNAWGGDKDARASFLYLMGTQMVMAGVRGVPLIAPLLFLMDAFGDDDDPEGDVETQLRNALADAFGADTARALWAGLPSMMGVDAGSLSMENLLSPLPFLRTEAITDARSGRDVLSELMVNVGGAPISLGTRVVDGFILMNEGDFQKGLEKVLPKFIAAPMKAQRLGDEGLTTRSGNVVLEGEEFSVWDQAIKAAGFSPAKESEYYKAMYQKERVSSAIDKRRQRIIKEVATGRMEGKDVSEGLKKLREFNKDHPQRRIDGDSIRRSIAMRRKEARERSKETGVRFTKRDAELRGIDRFAR
jgi:hypothetical protein